MPRANNGMERVNLYIPRDIMSVYRTLAKSAGLPTSELMRAGLRVHSAIVLQEYKRQTSMQIPKAKALHQALRVAAIEQRDPDTATGDQREHDAGTGGETSAGEGHS